MTASYKYSLWISLAVNASGTEKLKTCQKRPRLLSCSLSAGVFSCAVHWLLGQEVKYTRHSKGQCPHRIFMSASIFFQLFPMRRERLQQQRKSAAPSVFFLSTLPFFVQPLRAIPVHQRLKFLNFSEKCWWHHRRSFQRAVDRCEW